MAHLFDILSDLLHTIVILFYATQRNFVGTRITFVCTARDMSVSKEAARETKVGKPLGLYKGLCSMK
jgi:phosphatidylglycerophosphate synthase